MELVKEFFDFSEVSFLLNYLHRLDLLRLYPFDSLRSLRVTVVGWIFSLKFQWKTVILSERAEGSGVERV